MNRKTNILAFVLLVCTLVSCNREDIFFRFNGNTRIGVNVTGASGISTKTAAQSAEFIGSAVLEDIAGQDFTLDMYVEENDMLPFDGIVSTRGSIVTSNDINVTGKSFAFNGWLRSTNRYPNDDSAGRINVEEDATNYHFVDAVATKGSSEWTLDQEAYWRDAVPTTFWSYYPKEDGARVLTLPGQTPTDAQQDAFTFTYTTPESVADQNDLLFAYNVHTLSFDSGTDSDGEIVDINFYHALAAIRFDVSGALKKGIQITGVFFNNIAVAGTCNVSGGATADGTTPGKVTFAWTPGTTGNRSQTVAAADFTETGLDGETEDALMPLSSGKFFFFIPQTITGQDVEIGIRYTDVAGEEITNTLILKHDPWAAGKIYTYKLNPADILDIEVVETCSESTKTEVSVKNTGNCKAFIRAAIVANWYNEDGDIVAPWNESDTASGAFSGLPGTDWEKGTDGFYYYKNAVEAGESTSKLFGSYTKTTATGKNLQMNIITQAAIYDNTKNYKSVWNY